MWPGKKDIPLFVGVPVIMTHRVYVCIHKTLNVCQHYVVYHRKVYDDCKLQCRYSQENETTSQSLKVSVFDSQRERECVTKTQLDNVHVRHRLPIHNQCKQTKNTMSLQSHDVTKRMPCIWCLTSDDSPHRSLTCRSS